MKYSLTYYEFNPDKKPLSGDPLASPFECYDEHHSSMDFENVDELFDYLMDLDKKFNLPTITTDKYIIAVDLGKIYVRKQS